MFVVIAPFWGGEKPVPETEAETEAGAIEKAVSMVEHALLSGASFLPRGPAGEWNRLERLGFRVDEKKNAANCRTPTIDEIIDHCRRTSRTEIRETT